MQREANLTCVSVLSLCVCLCCVFCFSLTPHNTVGRVVCCYNTGCVLYSNQQQEYCSLWLGRCLSAFYIYPHNTGSRGHEARYKHIGKEFLNGKKMSSARAGEPLHHSYSSTKTNNTRHKNSHKNTREDCVFPARQLIPIFTNGYFRTRVAYRDTPLREILTDVSRVLYVLYYHLYTPTYLVTTHIYIH